ncbi:MAG: ABC transporter ATP-binding protein, partial [Planctomycetota bacterium]
MNKLFRMARFVTPYKWRLFFFFFTAVGYSVFNSLPLFLIREFLVVVIRTKDLDRLLITSGLIFACWLVRVYFLIRRAVAQQYLAVAAVRDATNQVTGHVLRRPLGFFDRWRSGELITRIGSDAGSLAQTVGIFTVLMREPLTIVGVLVVIFSMNWKLALIGLVGFPLAGLPIAALGRKIRRLSRSARETGADRADAMIQVIGAMRVVKGFGREELETRRFVGTNAKLFDLSMKSARVTAIMRGVVEMVNGIGVVAVFAIGGVLAIGRDAGFGAEDLLTFLAAFAILHGPTRSLGTANATINSCLPGAERLFELLDVRGSLPVPKDAVRVGPPVEGIVLRDVSFSYGREQVISGVDVEIQAGKVTAIVGPSGSGKSTLINLVARFYDPDGGAVEVDGNDLKVVEPASWLGHMGLVTQDPVLFNISILENIRYGRIDAAEEEVHAAARIANIHDDIMKLPEGYGTPAGERGMQLSGGQRQRICLARALVRDPAVLLLDEATSSLDSASEKIVQEAIGRAQAGRTSVVVAHRLSTVIDADRIYVLVNGNIEAMGPHAQRLEKSPTYKKLWSIQQGKAV